MSSLQPKANRPAFWTQSDSARCSKEDQIAGERRYDRRYELHLELHWKLIRRRKVLCEGAGRTVDVSSGGILVEVGRSLPAGLNLELSIAWPVLLHDVAPLQLTVVGRIVRSEGRMAAIRTVQHEFRTLAASVKLPAALPAPARTPLTTVNRVLETAGRGNLISRQMAAVLAM